MLLGLEESRGIFLLFRGKAVALFIYCSAGTYLLEMADRPPKPSLKQLRYVKQELLKLACSQYARSAAVLTKTSLLLVGSSVMQLRDHVMSGHQIGAE